MKSDIKDINLAEAGQLRIEWADKEMSVLRKIREDFAARKPLKDIRIAACLHVTTETANLVGTLVAGGAKVALCASNPLSTQDDVAAALVAHYEVPTFSIKGEDSKTYYDHINATLDFNPVITMDDGADLVSELHKNRQSQIQNVWAGTEETTTGVIRLKSMEKNNVLKYPIIAVNAAFTKHLFDNRYGTGQSTIDGILRATNILLAGKSLVVCGYGWCGKGVAMRARGMGALVVIVEVDPIKALEAIMDGFNVMPLSKAAEIGDIFVTLTGNIHVLRKEHFLAMKDGVVICNSGHFNVEIDIPVLTELAENRIRTIRPYVAEYKLNNNKKIYLLAEGRLINLSSAEGHPACVMDMSFANQALGVEYIANNYKNLECKVYDMPLEIDKSIAKIKLETMGIRIDELTEEQEKYLLSWEFGT